jgi:hypothetical protein
VIGRDLPLRGSSLPNYSISDEKSGTGQEPGPSAKSRCLGGGGEVLIQGRMPGPPLGGGMWGRGVGPGNSAYSPLNQ